MELTNTNHLPGLEVLNEMIESWSIKFSPRFLTYWPEHQIVVSTETYTLKTATSSDELMNVFRLRYLMFLEDAKKDDAIYDLDDFDHICDHLIIKDNKTNNVVGTYRMMASTYTDKFYSQTEFDMSEFLKLDGVKLELGRACIDPGHRNGSVIDLLWKGIATYSKKVKAKYLFGCSSIKTINPNYSFNVMEYFKEKKYMGQEFNIKPLVGFKMDFSTCTREDNFNGKEAVAPLLRSYLSAGAKVYGAPALDKEFGCIDFLTVLNLDEVNRLFKRRYFQ